MKNILILMLLFISSNAFYLSFAQQVEKNDSLPELIVIANVGLSNYSIGSLIISCDSIKSIDYPNDNYDMYKKYGHYVNIILEQDTFKELFNYLNQYENCIERPYKFIREEKNALIIDYRSKEGKECRMLSIQNIDAALFIVENIFCFCSTRNYGEQILDCLKWIHQFLIDTYDWKKDKYKSNIICY